MPKVSVIIATHSRPNLLPRAVESAKNAGSDVEVIVVDDASTDETAAVCREMSGINYVRLERNQRTAGARNVGIMNSSSPYISFLDDDDWRLPDSLDGQVRLLDGDPEIGLVYGRYLFADQNGNVTDEAAIPAVCPQGDVFWQIIRQNPIGCLTAVFRKSCLSSVGLLDQTIPGTDDLDLWIRIAEIYKVAAVEEPVAVWRKPTAESGQGSSNFVKLYSQTIRTFKKKWSKLPRAIAEKKMLEQVSEHLIDDIMNQMLFDAARTATIKDSFGKFYVALNSCPEYLYRPYTHKVMMRALLDRINFNKTRL